MSKLFAAQLAALSKFTYGAAGSTRPARGMPRTARMMNCKLDVAVLLIVPRQARWLVLGVELAAASSQNFCI